MRRNAFKIITEEEFISCSWWYADGTQPISNGGRGIVINKKQEPIAFISSCGNCGDFQVTELDNIEEEIKKAIDNK